MDESRLQDGSGDAGGKAKDKWEQQQTRGDKRSWTHHRVLLEWRELGTVLGRLQGRMYYDTH